MRSSQLTQCLFGYILVIEQFYIRMSEIINESVSVNLLNKQPINLSWRGRRYIILKLGLHYMEHEGRVLMHLFSITDGTTCFKLRFNTETLVWKLLEVADGV